MNYGKVSTLKPMVLPTYTPLGSSMLIFSLINRKYEPLRHFTPGGSGEVQGNPGI